MVSGTPALPPGVLSQHVLPADHHDGPWDHIITPDGLKERLLGQALLTLVHGRRLATLAGLPHGLIVLAGPPGTGKTTLGRGLAQAAALAVAAQGATTFVEIDPHAFPSELLGESQRAVTRLMRDTIPELAAKRPHTIVLVDEVEAFAVARSAASLATNPVDVHRATDAVLAGVDAIAADLPRVLFVATTNFLAGVDEAFLSRADLVVTFELPDADTIARIIRHALAELAGLWPALKPLAEDDELHRLLAGRCAGWDGRRVRKLALSALAQRLKVARDPARLTTADLLAATEPGWWAH
jgi:SpoVK/Ycf46/Vps4 family AAA+-type ATPase